MKLIQNFWRVLLVNQDNRIAMASYLEPNTLRRLPAVKVSHPDPIICLSVYVDFADVCLGSYRIETGLQRDRILFCQKRSDLNRIGLRTCNEARAGNLERPDTDRGKPLLHHAEGSCRRVREVDNSTLDKRPAIIHPNPDRSSVLEMRDLHPRAERKRSMRGADLVHIEDFPTRRWAPMKLGSIPGGNPHLCPRMLWPDRRAGTSRYEDNDK